MPKDLKRIEYRVRESWHARACAAGMSVGAQVFLFGTGVAMPLTLNSAWMAAFGALPLAGLVAAACRKKSKRRKRLSRAACVLLSLCQAKPGCTMEDFLDFARMYSSEIEYSQENMDALLDALWEEA